MSLMAAYTTLKMLREPDFFVVDAGAGIRGFGLGSSRAIGKGDGWALTNPMAGVRLHETSTMISHRKWNVTGLIVVITIFFVMYKCESRGPNMDNGKTAEIERLWAMVPIFPGMVEIDRSSQSSGTRASVGKRLGQKQNTRM
jgi:hypothetical protein